jgi:hypothetical protein
MLKESIRDLVLSIAEGDTLAIEDSFNSVMASKISDRLDSMRVDVAQGMFGSVDESYDSSDAYETWDPKHPKFKDKLIKHHAKGGTTKSFIDQEKAKAKKKLTREEVELEEDTIEKVKVPVGTRPKGIGWVLHKAGEQSGADHSIYKRKTRAVAATTYNKEELTLEDYSVEELEDFMMSEDFEQLDEVSKKTLGSYVNKAHDQLMKHTAASNFKSGRGDADAFAYSRDEKTMRKEKNRKAGVSTAIGKLTKEEVEELDEISKATLGSYVKKASGKLASHGINMVGSLEKSDIANAAYHGRKIDKRQKGISKATDKLTKEEFALEDYSLEELEDFMMSEEFEQLDELSRKTLGSYVKKATTNAIISGEALGKGEKWSKSGQIASKREKGIGKAVDKLTKD